MADNGINNSGELDPINFIAEKIQQNSQKERVQRNLILLERLKKNREKMAKRFNIRLSFLFLIIITMVYAGLELLMHQTNQEVYEQFLNNLNQDIIIDFYIEWIEPTCNSSYVPLFEYKHRRVFKGCDCSQSKNLTQEQNHKSEIFIGKGCTQSNLKQSCFTFSQEVYSDLIYLNNNNSGAPFLICAKRDKNISLKDNFTQCEQQVQIICNNTAKQCSNLSCPVTQFGIKYNDINGKNNDTGGNNDDTGGNNNNTNGNNNGRNIYINLDNDKVFYFQYNKDRLPISQVYLIKGEKMCKLNSQQAFSEQQILSENQQESCKEFDNLFQNVYALSEEQLFLSNNLLQYKNELSHFYIDKNHSWTLQAKPFTEIEEKCLKNGYCKNMLNNKYEKTLLILKLIQLFIILLLSIVIKLIEYYLKKKYLKQNDYNRSIQKVQKNQSIQDYSFDQKQQLNDISNEQNQQQFQDLQSQNISQNNLFRIIQIIRIFHATALIIVIQIIQYQINTIFEEIQLIINIPCIINDEANNYLKYYTQDHPISSFLNILKFSIIILYGIQIIKSFAILCGMRIKRKRIHPLNAE